MIAPRDPRRPRLTALVAALAILGAPATAAAQDPSAPPTVPTVPAVPTVTTTAPTVAPTVPTTAPSGPVAPAPAEVRGPIVHIVVKNEDPNKGPLKLARYRGARPVATSGQQLVIPTYFDELCTAPCGVAIDVSERPMLFFVRDGTPVSHFFRLNNLDGHITVKVRTLRRGLLMAGVMTYLFLVGIPMLIAATPKVWMAKGSPGPDLRFKRLWRARF